MMGYCCRSSSLSHSGVRERQREGEAEMERERETDGERLVERKREGVCSRLGEKKALIPIGPQDMRV